MAESADLPLLSGLLVLQIGLINQCQFAATFQAWTLDMSKSLADHLQARGDLTGAERAPPAGLAEVRLLSAGVGEYNDARGDSPR
jgi:hypothetical protein